MTDAVVDAVGDFFDAVLADQLASFAGSLADVDDDDFRAALLAAVYAEVLQWKVETLLSLRAMLLQDDRLH